MVKFENLDGFVDAEQLKSLLTSEERQAVSSETQDWLAKEERPVSPLVRIAVLAGVVFEEQQRAIAWLTTPQVGLVNRVPLQLLQTEAGAQEVHDLLGRIELGVFS